MDSLLFVKITVREPSVAPLWADKIKKERCDCPKNQPIDAETLLSTPLSPVRWLIPELLPKKRNLRKPGRILLHIEFNLKSYPYEQIFIQISIIPHAKPNIFISSTAAF